ncbi:MAG: diguanylate cyclase [Pontixanthobacter sp.]
MSHSASANLPTLRQILAKAHLRLILLAVALAAVSLVVSGTLVIRGYVQRNLDLTAQSINYVIEPAIVFNDIEAIEEGVSSVASMESVDRIEVLDADGKRLIEWHKPTEGVRAKFENAVNGFLWPSPATSQVTRSGEVLANIRVYGSSTSILDYALSGFIIALACLGLTIIATRILARKLQDEVIRPLEKVANVAHAVRKERAFSERLPSAGIEEIDRFTQDFNALLAELEGWHDGLTNENAELTRKATHDELTGLGNRALFEQALNSGVASALKMGGALAVIYLDADGFKSINDSHGHEAGDLALLEVARRLNSSIRSTDSAYRLGGDEFAIILSLLHERTHLELVTRRIEDAMVKSFILPNGTAVKLSMSMGISIFPDDGQSPQDLLRRADAAMYRDKNDKKKTMNDEGNND